MKMTTTFPRLEKRSPEARRIQQGCQVTCFLRAAYYTPFKVSFTTPPPGQVRAARMISPDLAYNTMLL